jgi:ABC-2 type transport system permease protein
MIAPRSSDALRLALIQIRAVFRKEVLQTLNDRRMMFMLIMAPTFQTFIFGYAANFNVDRVPTVVVDRDRSEQSREHIRRMLADGTLRHTASVESVAEAERLFETGGAAAAIVLPPHLGEDLLAGRPAEVQVIIDGSDPNRSTVASSTVSRYFGEVAMKLAKERLPAELSSRQATIAATPRVWYNPRLLTPVFMIPGILAMLLVVATTIVVSMGLAREREMGTLEQVLVTPIRPLYLLVGKMVPFLFTGLIDVLLILTLGTWVFDVPMRGDLAVLGLGTFLFLLSTLGVGLLISTVSSTQQQAFLGGFLFAMPAILLSGVMTPIRAMPIWLQAVTYLNPLRYYAQVMRADMIKGAGFADLWQPLLALLVFGVGILATSVLRFQKRVT